MSYRLTLQPRSQDAKPKSVVYSGASAAAAAWEAVEGLLHDEEDFEIEAEGVAISWRELKRRAERSEV